MSRDFFAISHYREMTFDESAIRGLVQHLIENECVIVHERGFIAGTLTPLFFAPHIKIAVELVWWAPNADGTRLRELFEAWAKDKGASGVQMTAQNNDYAARLTQNLTRNGYTPIEVAYLKAI